jgi:thymidylate synthase
MNTVDDIRVQFNGKLLREEFVKDRNGGDVIEIIGASFYADDITIFGQNNEKYENAEISWYKSRSTNINDLEYEPIPQAWKDTANEHGEINSNYGKLIYDNIYGSQFDNVLYELKNDPFSRRATMIYTRPTIWQEFEENGKNDFICTNAVTYYVRDGMLQAVVQMRSNDAVYGFKNDFAWQYYVLQRLEKELGYGIHWPIWQVQNLHVYEKHFDLIRNYDWSK